MGAYMEYLGFIPEEWTYGSALQRTYLERVSVHACTQMYTREYTMVYTRVHSSLLGSRYMHGRYVHGERIQLSLGYPPRVLCSRVLVTSYLSLLVRGGRLGSDYMLQHSL